jgi:nascent polypeptide-associated complex subunit alpha
MHNAAQGAAVAGDMMFPGLGKGINPRKMASMMKQMGIDISEIENVEEVIIRTSEKDIIFKDAQVTIMDARGMKTYQIMGTPQEVAHEAKIPEGDVKLVMEQAKASENDARAALKETKGDIAAAIMRLSKTG